MAGCCTSRGRGPRPRLGRRLQWSVVEEEAQVEALSGAGFVAVAAATDERHGWIVALQTWNLRAEIGGKEELGYKCQPSTTRSTDFDIHVMCMR